LPTLLVDYGIFDVQIDYSSFTLGRQHFIKFCVYLPHFVTSYYLARMSQFCKRSSDLTVILHFDTIRSRSWRQLCKRLEQSFAKG
jgi:hypothetical protein